MESELDTACMAFLCLVPGSGIAGVVVNHMSLHGL